MEEAYYGWLALNYHRGVMGSLSTKGTFGSLDLGGSSLQVTFETEKPVYDGTGINLSLGMVSHHLSAYSLPGYGLNDAFDKSVAQLIKKITINGKIALTGGAVVLPHPCLQSGYKEIYFCTQCLTVNSGGSPLTGGILEKGASGLSVTLVGAPQWEECSALAKQVVNKSEWSGLGPAIDCKLLPCALGDSLPKPLGKFYATSGFFVVFRFFNLTSKASLNDVFQRGQEFCEKPWAVAKTSVAPQPFIEQYCFRAPYIISLLRDGLHIRDREVFVGSGSITWTLGVGLLEAGKAFSTRIELPYRVLNTDISPSILLLLLLMSVIVLCCAVSCANFPTARFLRRFYLPQFRRNSATATASSMVIPSPFGLPRWIPLNSDATKSHRCWS
ncbi:hypothetical protein HPP92_016789 [Vanilla planifolia]|uniref:Apyrase n=1 Tax=Vanilla planifolia TaxID=51239 RepID=A0A835QCW2_VANPL|nr:hypothetical protein HPP92_016789 [Vanilla planifolia]